MGNYQLTIQYNITNPHNTETITYTSFIVVVNEGSYSVINGSAIKQIGVVTHENALSAYNFPEASYASSESVYGGDFFGSLKKFFSPVGDFVKGAYNVGREIAPYVKGAYDIGKTIAPLFGVGTLGGKRCPAGMRKKCMKAPKRRKSRKGSKRRGRGGVMMGDGLYGGEFIDRNDLTYADEVSNSGSGDEQSE